MKDYITNTIILKNGDQVEIAEPASLPLNQKLMYQIENAEHKVIINNQGTKTIIPVENILFATSSSSKSRSISIVSSGFCWDKRTTVSTCIPDQNISPQNAEI